MGIKLNNVEIVYEWAKYFKSADEAMQTATRFHEKLRGNDDYKESRIILNVMGTQVTITQFSDSLTTIEVAEDNRGLVYLKVSAPVIHSAGHILGREN